MHETDYESLVAAAEIDPIRLQDEFINLPATLAYWNAKRAEALRLYLLAKTAAKQAEAEAYLRVIEREAAKEKRDRLTVDGIKACVTLDPMVMEAHEAEARMDAEHQRLRGAADAIITKREMLVSIGAHIRAEMKGDPALLTRRT